MINHIQGLGIFKEFAEFFYKKAMLFFSAFKTNYCNISYACRSGTCNLPLQKWFPVQWDKSLGAVFSERSKPTALTGGKDYEFRNHALKFSLIFLNYFVF
jgi:hypothetical protein